MATHTTKYGQEAAAQPSNEKRTRLLRLLSRIEDLETRIKELETGCNTKSMLR